MTRLHTIPGFRCTLTRLRSLRLLSTGLNIGLVVSCMALLFAPPELVGVLTYDRSAILAGQAWRLWTGHLTHFSMQHMLVDTGVLALLIVLLQREAGALFISVAVLTGMPLLSLGLLVLVPGLSEYRGASGLDVMLGVALGVHIWQSRSARIGLLVLGLSLLAKISLEALGMGSTLSQLPSGIRVVWEAHALGAVIGVVLACCWRPARSVHAG